LKSLDEKHMRREIIRTYGRTGYEGEDHSLFFSATEANTSDDEEGQVPRMIVDDVDKDTNREKLLGI
jgi:hypothetical protein